MLPSKGGNILNQVLSARLTAASPSTALAAVGLLLGRICFAADFLLFGARKFSDPSIIYKLIVAHHLPGELVYPAMFLQLVGGACILLGLRSTVDSRIESMSGIIRLHANANPRSPA